MHFTKYYSLELQEGVDVSKTVVVTLRILTAKTPRLAEAAPPGRGRGQGQALHFILPWATARDVDGNVVVDVEGGSRKLSVQRKYAAGPSSRRAPT